MSLTLNLLVQNRRENATVIKEGTFLLSYRTKWTVRPPNKQTNPTSSRFAKKSQGRAGVASQRETPFS